MKISRIEWGSSDHLTMQALRTGDKGVHSFDQETKRTNNYNKGAGLSRAFIYSHSILFNNRPRLNLIRT